MSRLGPGILYRLGDCFSLLLFVIVFLFSDCLLGERCLCCACKSGTGIQLHQDLLGMLHLHTHYFPLAFYYPMLMETTLIWSPNSKTHSLGSISLESEDAYFFIREFEEVCLIMRISQLGEDVVRLRFIPFVLKNMAKKWLYNLHVSSISSWDNFVKVFFNKFYPIHKTALIRKNIMQYR